MIFNSHHQPNIIVPITGTTAQMLLEEARAAEAAGADRFSDWHPGNALFRRNR